MDYSYLNIIAENLQREARNQGFKNLGHDKLMEHIMEELKELEAEYVMNNEMSNNFISYVEDKDRIDEPVGYPIELVDIMILLFELAANVGIDLGEAMRLKVEYNKIRKR